MDKSKLGKIIKKVYDIINSQDFLEQHRIHPADFTRMRKLSFSMLIVFILSSTKSSLQAALLHLQVQSNLTLAPTPNKHFLKLVKKLILLHCLLCIRKV